MRHIAAEITESCVILTEISDGDHSVMWQNTQPRPNLGFNRNLCWIKPILENILILKGLGLNEDNSGKALRLVNGLP